MSFPVIIRMPAASLWIVSENSPARNSPHAAAARLGLIEVIMISFAMLPYNVQCILGAAYALVTSLLLYLLINAWMEHFFCIGAETILLFTGSLCILQAMTEEMNFYMIRIESADSSVPSSKQLVEVNRLLSPLLERIPVFLLLLILVLISVSLYLLRRRFQREKSSHLTPSAIKENMDYMPVGICYGAADGLPLLVNAQMDRLCASLFGTEILNANRFWNDLKSISNPAEVHLSDGTIWDFRRTQLKDRDGRWEILAYNITEQYRLGEELAEDSRRQQELNQRLHKLNREINLVTREDEILRAKIRIHDEVGHALLSYRLYQSQSPKERHPREMLALWDYIVRVMKREAEESTGTTTTFWQDFLKKAQALQVQVVLRGDPNASNEKPEAEEAEKTENKEKTENTGTSSAVSLIEKLTEKRDPEENVLCIALQECLTNTVKHGRGDILYICAWERNGKKDSDRVEVTVYNNGVPPEENIRETGGLGNLRRLAVQQGVEMHIESSPMFLLKLCFPVE